MRADGYLSRLHALVPDFTDATELLIQVNQSLKRDVKVENLIRDYRLLHGSGKIPAFSNSIDFVRERIELDQDSEMIVTQAFDYKKEPNTVWMGEVIGADGQVKRQFELVYDPEATAALRAKDPKWGSAEEFLLVENVIKDGHIRQVDVYFQIFAMPEYKKVRNTMLAIYAGSMKSIYSQTVGQ